MWRVLRPGGVLISYDLGPAPAPIRAAGRLTRRRSAQPWTPVVTLDRAELRRLFPDAHGHARSVTLNAALPVALRSRRGLRLALAQLPPLRSHLLFVAAKPA